MQAPVSWEKLTSEAVQADTWLRAPEDKVFMEGFHWQSMIFITLTPWNGDVTLNLLLHHTRSLTVFGAQVPPYMPLVYVCSRCTDSADCMEVSVWSCNSGHTMFLKNGEQIPH